ncbi:hypothetical protein CC86DRAFT_376336 [Ophiobolus disseminans]|uniref:F-box domain-containing protein n=1 Tax=Ophiobolus disseminans TaxID=1469910 RepID=A0A6A7AKH8_9PLEO|nr:hypothetical protein CC86DRAFT_376336 [Ophiobolus disseminans]
MSLDALSTELDDEIVRRLAKSELEALSRTTKYYRALSEPYLYKNPEFATNEARRIILLFQTIVRRQELAKYIRSFTVTPDQGLNAHSTFTQADDTEMWQNVTIVKEVIAKITQRRDLKLTLRWFGLVFGGEPLFDGALAIILCLALNLEHLDLAASRDDMLSITLVALNYTWRSDDNNANTSAIPFRKLRNLSIEAKGDHQVPHLPWLSILRTKSKDRGKINPQLFCFPYLDDGLGTRLSTLDIRGVNFDPYWLESTLSRPQFAGLKQLMISRQDSGTSEVPDLDFDLESQGWFEYDFERMSEAICNCLPGLEVLEWSRHARHPRYHHLHSFGSLKDLDKLWSMELLIEGNDAYHLNEPRVDLPASLTDFHISNLIPGHWAMGHILEVARDLGLRRLELSICMENVWSGVMETRELGLHKRNYFTNAVSGLSVAGSEMRVWRQEGLFAEKLLFAPGFTEPWPQWKDVDMECWCEADHVAYYDERLRQLIGV